MNPLAHQREAPIEGLWYKRGHLGKAYYDNGYEWILSENRTGADVARAAKDYAEKEARMIEANAQQRKSAGQKSARSSVDRSQGSVRKKILDVLAASSKPLSLREISSKTSANKNTARVVMRVMARKSQIKLGARQYLGETNRTVQAWIINKNFKDEAA